MIAKVLLFPYFCKKLKKLVIESHEKGKKRRYGNTRERQEKGVLFI